MHRDLALHLARTSAILVLLGVATARGSTGSIVVLSIALHLACFAFAHDALHGALDLSRRGRHVALAVLGTMMLTSGHAMRRLHLRHHARPLADEDVEGRGARRTLLGAVLDGPGTAWAIRREALRERRDRGWVLVETGANVACAVAAALVPALRAPIAIAVAFQCTASVWASHLPHHAPRWLVAIAARGASVSPTLASLAYHDVHHARPRVPCRALRRIARTMR